MDESGKKKNEKKRKRQGREERREERRRKKHETEYQQIKYIERTVLHLLVRMCVFLKQQKQQHRDSHAHVRCRICFFDYRLEKITCGIKS